MNRSLSILLILGVLGVSCAPKKAAEEDATVEPTIEVQVASVETKDIKETLKVEGAFTFSPSDYAKLAPASGGRLSRVRVQEGDTVKAGDLLAQLDMSVLQAQKMSAAIGAESSGAQARQAQTALQASTLEFDAQTKAAELNLQSAILERDSNVESARTDLAKLRAGARPQEIAVAEQSVRQARVTRDKARSDSDRDQQLFSEGYVSGQQAQASKAALDLAESSLDQAEKQLEITKLGARTEDVRAAEIRLSSAKALGEKKVQSARAALDQARQGRVALMAKAQEARAADLAASQKSQDAKVAQGQAAMGEIRAPFSGRIVKRLLGPGDSADATTPVFEIIRTGARFDFTGYVPTSTANRLAEGMSVQDADGAEIGSLRSIGVTDSVTGQVPIKVSLRKPSRSVVPGSFGRVAIVIRAYPHSLAVPEACVITRDDKTYVFIAKDDKALMRAVDVGPTQQGFTAIKKGLLASDKVILLGQHELADGSKIQLAKAEADK